MIFSKRGALRCSSLLWVVLWFAIVAPCIADSVQARVKIATVSTRLFSQERTVYGEFTVDPRFQYSVALSRAGVVSQLYVKPGDRLRKGDPLFDLLTGPDARNQHQISENAYIRAKQEYERQLRLVAEHLSSNAQLQLAQQAYDDAKSAVQASRSNGLDKESEMIRAAQDVIVVAVAVMAGQRVPADTSAIILAPTHKIIAHLQIMPEDADLLQPETVFQISPIFQPQSMLVSKQFSLSAQLNSANMLSLSVSLEAADTAGVVLGSPVKATIVTDPHEALSVPREALVYEGEQAFAFRVNQQSAERVAIDRGLSQGGFVEIKQGLNPDDSVVIEGAHSLENGMQLKVLQ